MRPTTQSKHGLNLGARLRPFSFWAFVGILFLVLALVLRSLKHSAESSTKDKNAEAGGLIPARPPFPHPGRLSTGKNATSGDTYTRERLFAFSSKPPRIATETLLAYLENVEWNPTTMGAAYFLTGDKDLKRDLAQRLKDSSSHVYNMLVAIESNNSNDVREAGLAIAKANTDDALGWILGASAAEDIGESDEAQSLLGKGLASTKFGQLLSQLSEEWLMILENSNPSPLRLATADIHDPFLRIRRESLRKAVALAVVADHVAFDSARGEEILGFLETAETPSTPARNLAAYTELLDLKILVHSMMPADGSVPLSQAPQETLDFLRQQKTTIEEIRRNATEDLLRSGTGVNSEFYARKYRDGEAAAIEWLLGRSIRRQGLR